MLSEHSFSALLKQHLKSRPPAHHVKFLLATTERVAGLLKRLPVTIVVVSRFVFAALVSKAVVRENKSKTT